MLRGIPSFDSHAASTELVRLVRQSGFRCSAVFNSKSLQQTLGDSAESPAFCAWQSVSVLIVVPPDRVKLRAGQVLQWTGVGLRAAT